MSNLDLTLEAAQAHGLTLLLLAHRSKQPAPRAGTWWTTTDAAVVRDHVAHGGNLGIVTGPVAVLDFDKPDALREMFDELGPVPPTVSTGSGKTHAYVAPDAALPARITWRGEVVGEVQRHDRQYVVCPPSIHPKTGEPYRWGLDPREPLPQLPDAWRKHLCQQRPDWLPNTRQGVPAPEPWTGPPPEELLRRALAQPGATHRNHGVKFQCPGCRAEGRDRSKDNATVFADGRWGCAVDNAHRYAIGVALGVLVETTPLPTLPNLNRLMRPLGRIF